MIKVLIAIQARSSNTRLPRKAYERIGNKMLLDHVISACKGSAHYNNRNSSKTGIHIDVAMLVPYNDPIGFDFKSRCKIYEGPEDDVLSRYQMSTNNTDYTYICRVTGDCPLIPPFIITKHITLAVKNRYHYVSNVFELFRTAVDGSDCEVMSIDLLNYIANEATDPVDREHVTTYIRNTPLPDRFTIGTVLHQFDHSDIKLSVDTPEDLERVRKYYDSFESKFKKATDKLGNFCVHKV